MGILTSEVRNIQNAALGAGLLWRFTCGYTKHNPFNNPVPLPLLFIVLPIILHEQTEYYVAGTQKASGLRAFAAKFGKSENCKQDLLLAIHNRMIALRELSLESLRMGIATHLIFLQSDATVFSLTKTKAISGIPKDVRNLMKSAEKLGVWCGSLTTHEIATTLKLRF